MTDRENWHSVSLVGDGEVINEIVSSAFKVEGVDVVRSDGPFGLTDRQLEAMNAAMKVDYYETPKKSTFADIAEELDCAPSTACELVGRAEETIIGSVMHSITEK